MSADPDSRTPVIVGAAQAIQRPGDWTIAADARGPIELMTAAAREAADDAGSAALLRRLGWIAVVGGFWTYRNPGQVIADQLGAGGARTALTAISGSAPLDAVGLAAQRIADGQLDVALIVGGEARWSQRQLRQLGEEPAWITADGSTEPESVGGFPAEMIEEARELGSAATAYALFDDSRRIARGDAMDAHRDDIAALWARFNAVAADNEFAWSRLRKTAGEIREPSPRNRMIAFPYTVDMVANNTVDMASATLICSLSAARSAGVDPDRFVYPHVSVHGHETWRIVDRQILHQAPRLAEIGRTAYEYAGISGEDVSHVDLYACFPAIVRMSAVALGIDIDRTLTLTGGLGFAGAPVANSSGQALAAMVPRVRRGGHGLIHANGGNATKHAVGIYANTPPRRPFRRIELNGGDVQLRPEPSTAEPASGHVEAATVAYDRQGPTHVVAAIRDQSGRRTLSKSSDADLITEATTNGVGGVPWPARKCD